MMTDARTSGFHWNLGGKEGDERIRRENAREREGMQQRLSSSAKIGS